MEDKRVEAFIRFIRRYAKLVAEVPALESLLDTYAETKTVPDNWREMLGEIRKSETYMSVLQEVEPIISKIRFPSVDEELIARLLKMSEGKPSN